MSIEPRWIKERFVECAIAFGYCNAAGKSDRAEPFRVDLVELAAAFMEFVPNAEAEMVLLMDKHESPWVQYAAAVTIARSNPQMALPTLRALSTQDGMWAPMSFLAVHQLELTKH